MRRHIAIALAAVFLSTGYRALRAAPPALDTTARTYVLFLDMQEVESLHNIELVVNQAEKHPANPVLPTGDMNDFDYAQASSWAGSVLFDEDEKIFKMWYMGGRQGMEVLAIGYAWSSDGVVWNKPKLGLYEFRGTKENNITWRSPTGQMVFGKFYPELTGHFAVFKDYAEKDPQKRYKGWNYNYAPATKQSAHYPVYSADGIHWTLGSQPIAKYPTGDIGNAFIDYADPDPAKRIKIYGHETAGYGPDIEHCIPSPFNPVISGPNRPDPAKEGLEDTIHLAAAMHYKGYYIMLYDYDFWMDYYGYKGKADIRGRDSRVPKPKTGIFTGDTRLAVNRDGVSKFQRVNPHQPIIARGKRGMWDSGFIVMPGPVVHDDKIYLFYSASDEVAGITQPQWNEPDSPFIVATGLATLRLDGFTNLQTHDGLSAGTVTTMPITVTDPQKARLVVNAANLMSYRDWIQVEILDAATNQPIQGFSKDESGHLFREGIRIPVEWSGHKTLDGIRQGQIKLRFYLYGQAKLYSFHFE
jgi:hypothetical protein